MDNIISQEDYLKLFKNNCNIDLIKIISQYSRFEQLLKELYDFQLYHNPHKLTMEYILEKKYYRLDNVLIFFICCYCEIDLNFINNYILNSKNLLPILFNNITIEKLRVYCDEFPNKFKLLYGKYFV